jgi:hypothetical protein
MKKLNSLVISIIILSQFAFSQNGETIRPMDNYSFYKLTQANELDVINYSEIKGSPYLTDNFVESKIYFSADTAFSLNLRYNIYEDRFEYKKNDKVFAIGNPKVIYKIEMLNNIFIYYVDKNNKIKNCYFRLLIEGNCSLVEKMEIRFEEKSEEKPYSGAKPAEFIRLNNKYYLILRYKSPELIKNVKIIPEILSDKENDISNFIKKEKISAKDENDLIKLVNYYNILTSK